MTGLIDLLIQIKLDEAQEKEEKNEMFEAALIQNEAQSLIFKRNLMYKM